MRKKLLILGIALSSLFYSYGQGNHVFGGSEAVNSGTIDFATPGGLTWSTFRGAIPGYFSALGAGTYTSASDANHVNGYVKKYGNTAFTFPVGTGTDLRTLAITAPSTATDAFGAAWILGNPTTTTDPTDGGTHNVASKALDVMDVNTVGQWDWVNVSGNPAGVTVTASIPNVSAFGLASQLRLVGWNGTQWVNLSGTQGAAAANGNTENSTLTGTLQNGITAIGVGKGYNTAYIKVFLQGAMVTNNTMSNNLTTSGFVPAAQPFNNSYFSYTGTELNNTLNSSAAVTDWVMVELRNTVTGAIADRVPAFLRTDGVVIDVVTGQPGVQFSNTIPGNYYLIVHHRNHLSVVSPTTISLPNTSPTTHDFTTGLAQALANGSGNSMKQTSTGVWAMWYGDYNHDQIIDGIDRNFVLNEFRQGLFDGYFLGDLNFDGFSDGLDNSAILINFSIGLESPLF